MSNVKFLVFEGGNTVLNMEKMSVFKNGQDMPWSYYEADILGDASNGHKYFMYTSKSAPGPNGEKAGEYVSEIKRYIPVGNGGTETFVSQTIANPTLDDYKKWGWPIKIDQTTKKEIIPKFGDFTFKPNTFPDYEETQDLKFKFKFGFGLNGTCYNFAEENADVCVYNLSCPPKVFCTNNKFCQISYNATDGSWGPDLTPMDDKNCITCDLEEGKDGNENRYGYLMVCVESGEEVNVEFLLANINNGPLQRINIMNEDGVLRDDTETGTLTYTKPYKANVPGPFDTVMGTNLKFDFYMIKFRPTDDYLYRRYNKNELIVNLKITPKSDGAALDSFSENVDLKINLLKEVNEPYILDANESTHGYKTKISPNYDGTAANGVFRRQQIIVTDKEAIKYGLDNNDPLLPVELRGLTQEQACKALAKSQLTELERCLYEYMLGLKNRIEDMAYFYSTAGYVIQNQYTDKATLEGELDAVLNGETFQTNVTQIRTAIATKASGNGNKLVSLSEIKSDGWMSQQYQAIVTGLVNTNDETGVAPWNWSNAKDCTQSPDLSQLVDNSNVQTAIKFALFDYKLNGTTNKVLSKLFGVADLTNRQEQYEALETCFHGFSIKDSSANDMSMGASYSRPEGLDLTPLKCKLNPVDAESANYYLCNVISDGSGNCGLNKYDNGKEYSVDASKNDVTDLLYGPTTKSYQVGANGNTESRGPVFKAINSTDDISGYAQVNSKYQFFKKIKSDMNDVTDRDLIGKHVFNTNAYNDASGGYNKINWPKEWEDISGLIRIPDASEGKYFDVCVDGVELKETVLPFKKDQTQSEDKAFENIGTDKRHSNAYTQDIIDSRNTDELKNYRYHANILNHEQIQFVRFGNMVRFFIDEDDVDSEKAKFIQLPKIEIKERGDTDGRCTKVFDDLCIYLNDVPSTLDLSVNYGITNIRSGTDYNNSIKDNSGVIVSRWNEIHVPIDVSGLLEKCECFTLCLTDDNYSGTNVTTGDLDDASNIADYSDSTNSKPTLVPQECEDEKYKLEFKYTDNGYETDIWQCVDDVEFCYACHNKKKPDTVDNDRNSYNSNGRADSTTTGDYSKSSNIEGLPIFRLVLPTQGKIVNYANKMHNISNEHPFESVLRSVNIKLKYSKTAGTNSGVTQPVHLIVKDDAYDPNITVSEYTYNKDTLKETITALPQRQNVTSSSDDLTAIYGTKAGDADQEAVPDYSKLIKCEFDFSDLSDGSNCIYTVDYLENLHGIEYPVAEINFSNFMINNEYAASASISHVFAFKNDEIKYKQNGLFGVKYENTDAHRFADDGVPRIIPANPNYEVKMLNGNTKALLIRKTPFNFEEWIGSSKDKTIIDGLDMWHPTDKNPVPELVTVRIDYRKPEEKEQASYYAQSESKYVHIYVTPADRKELKWGPEETMTFNFDVAEGEGKLDITSVISATLHNRTSDQIKYYVRGVVDSNGDVSFHQDLSQNCAAGVDYSGLAKTLVNNFENDPTFENAILKTQDLFFALGNNNQIEKTSDVSNVTGKDLKDYMVNGKLNIYHKNYNVENKENEMFDAYQRKYYSFFVEALYHNTNKDQSCVESCLALVNIHVNPPQSGFKLNDTKKGWCYEVVESMGEADRSTAEKHNPQISIKDLIKDMTHEDSKGADNVITKNSGADLSDGFKVTICKLDEALELCHTNGNILDSYIKLRETDANKTTETAILPSTKNAQYVHYNYERQSQYNIEIEFCLDNLVELPVTKCSNTYVCGFGDAAEATTAELKAIAGGKTCSFLADLSTDERAAGMKSGQLSNEKLYYFKNPETHMYEGPFSTQPYSMDQLRAKRTLFNLTDLKYAYLRVRTADANGEDFTPLYKTPESEFSNSMVKAPKPTDCTKQVFAIKVKNGLDKPQSCPQPYELQDKECHDYCTADPQEEISLDSDQIMVNAGDSHICYVFSDHKDFYKVSDLSDFAGDEGDITKFTPPSWSGVTAKQDVSGRQFFNALKMSNKNKGMYTGTKDGSANESIRFGKFQENYSNSIVPLAHFVEFHDGCIDQSGFNETSVSNYIGSRVDYSGTVWRYQYQSKDASGNLEKVPKSDCDLYELINVKQNRYHGETPDISTSVSNNYFTTAELAFGKDFVAQPDKVYRFSVATVLNVNATNNDLSFNENMVDFQKKYYPKVNGYFQPFQKYVYDKEQEAIVTVGYARTIDNTVGDKDKIDNPPTSADHRFSQPLLVCRNHFTVCTKDGTLVIENA